jgi:hypothetical protein
MRLPSLYLLLNTLRKFNSETLFIINYSVINYYGCFSQLQNKSRLTYY